MTLPYIAFTLLAIEYAFDMRVAHDVEILPYTMFLFAFQAFYCDFLPNLVYFVLIFVIQQIIDPVLIVKIDHKYTGLSISILILSVLFSTIFHISTMMVGQHVLKLFKKIQF